MMHTKHLTTPTQALYRVFVLPTLPQTAPLRPAIQHSHHAGKSRQIRQQQPFSTTPVRPVKNRAPVVRKESWDEEIKSSVVYIIPDSGIFFDPETGKPPEPVRRDVLLRSLDRQTHRLVQVAPGLDLAARESESQDVENEGEETIRYRPSQNLGTDEGKTKNWVHIPVCKVVSKKAAYEASVKSKQQAKEKRKISNVASSVKTLELNWAIDQNDLGHRIERIQDFLTEGRKVEVVLAAKKKGRKASGEECEAALGRIRKAVADVDGAKEVGGMEGKMGGFAVLRFQGRMPAAVSKEA